MRELPIEDPLQFELYEKQGEQHLKAFLSGSGRGDVEVLAVEQDFQIMVEDVPIRGRFDRVDRLPGGKLRVLDYKTGNPKDEKAAEESLQLALYAIAAAEKYGELPARVAFHNLENDSIVEITPEDTMLRNARKAVKETADGIANGRFHPNPTFKCKWCAYQILCPATAEKIYTIQPAAATSGA